MKEGSEVVVRCTVKGTEKSADEIGKAGKNGIKVTKGTVTKIDKDTKAVVAKSAGGTEKAFEHTGDAGKDVVKDTGKGIDKGAKLTIYYTEDAGKKIAHFLSFSNCFTRSFTIPSTALVRERGSTVSIVLLQTSTPSGLFDA